MACLKVGRGLNGIQRSPDNIKTSTHIHMFLIQFSCILSCFTPPYFFWLLNSRMAANWNADKFIQAFDFVNANLLMVVFPGRTS